MHAARLLHKQLQKSCPEIHQVRLESLMLAVSTAVCGNAITISSLGRGVNNHVSPKHNIKRMDRLIGNTKLHLQRQYIYSYLAKASIGNKKRPLIAVDWSGLSECGAYHFLRASLILDGRTLTLYEESFPEALLYNAKVETNFLQDLSSILPSTSCPIIITDAGFKNRWFKDVLSLGWDYVGRVRGKTYLRLPDENQWKYCKTMHKLASTRPKYLGEYELAKANPLCGNMYLQRQDKKNRIKKNLRGKKVMCSQSLKFAKRQDEPWLLITSLKHNANGAKKICNLYKKRMQIEESFRDTKSHYFGLGLRQARTNIKSRYDILLLIASITLFLLWLIGYCAKKEKLHYQYQANTTRHRNVLSIIYLGLEVMRREPSKITPGKIQMALQNLAEFEGNNYVD